MGIIGIAIAIIFGGIIIPRIIEGQNNTTLEVAIVSWNIIGIDDNKPKTEGPNCSIVQVRIWNNGSYNATNVRVNFSWSAENATYIYLHGNERTEKNIGTIENNSTKDVFFVVNITRSSASKDKTRAFTINVTADNANPANASQKLRVEGLREQSDDSSKLVYISNSNPAIGEEFEVHVWDNTTSAATNCSFPLEYDPAVIELVNVTVNTSGSLTYEVYMDSNAAGSHYVIYRFKVLNAGATNITTIMQDLRGGSYKYNSDYGKVNITITPVYPEILVSKTVWNGSSWGENVTKHVGENIVFNITVKSNGTENLSYINITDILPSCFSYVSGSAKKNDTPISDPVQWGNNISWNLTGPFPNSTWFYIIFNATAGCKGNFTNVANVSAEGNRSHIMVYDEDEASVNVINSPPVANNDYYSTNEDTQLVVNAPGVLGNDSDIDGDTLTAILVSSPSHGSLTFNSNGSFTYTPDANYHGTDSFTYKANDGQADSNIATVYITINSVNDPPIANDDYYSTNEDTQLVVNAPGVLGNDSDIDGDTLTAILVSSPSHG
ncbi:MAG: tandem-95 repeat protein, partial [Thermoplasmatales archaeon]|nr:tandem-95 repeat protein [Thermoplasmatales archaeon]